MALHDTLDYDLHQFILARLSRLDTYRGEARQRATHTEVTAQLTRASAAN